MRLPVAAIIICFIGLATTGCTNTQRLAQQRRMADSLQTVASRARADMFELRDTLQFYRSIASGAYYRDRRLLVDRIDALTYDLAVARQGGVTVEVLPVNELFQPATADLTTAGRARVAEIADRLTGEYGASHTYRVEGHSDNVPIGPGLIEQYPSNWELAAARAAAVARALVDEGIPPDRLVVVSYGESKPTARNDTAAGRARNRRVRIAALPPYQPAPVPAPPQ